MPAAKAFTLVELLVVVAIIAVLLSLLMPALDRAVYQTELAVCAARLHAVAGGATAYAMDQRRRYPHRRGVHETNVWQPYMLNLIPTLAYVYTDVRTATPANGYDDRPVIRGYIPINKALNDPMCRPVNLETTQTDSMVTASYDLWYGYGYKSYTGNAAETAQGQKITARRRPQIIQDNSNGVTSDDRARLHDMLGGFEPLLDPLALRLDLAKAPVGSVVYTHYSLWFGMSYAPAAGGGQGMRRLGDRLEWMDSSRGEKRGHRFSVLASDWDQLMPTFETQTAGQKVITAHSDKETPQRAAALRAVRTETAEWWVTWWTSPTTSHRGPIDLNFAGTDGVVSRVNDVFWDDDRMARVPYDVTVSQPSNAENGVWNHLPRN